jgi:hypothetical protein
MNRTLMILAAGLFAVAACDKPSTPETKPDDPASKNATTTGATTTAATTAAAPVVIADSDLSTPADFEETAEKAISKANYKTELASLETDIAKE